MTILLALLLTIAPQQLESQSQDARALLRQRNYPAASAAAKKVYDQAIAELKNRPLDKESLLPLALGAAIEVQAQSMSAQGARSEAVTYLQAELKKFYGTSIRARIQKNIHLLSLEGRPAPALAVKGKPTLLFFWAHWCSDCRGDAPVVAKLQSIFPSLAIVGPTQHYGYVDGGAEATRAQESAYIEKVRKQLFGSFPAPVNEENFRLYGASTTPTFVLIDQAGLVRMYHPGAMSYDDLASRIKPLIESGPPRTGSRAEKSSGL